MKKIVLSLISVLFVITASFGQSSEYKSFKVDVGGLYALPSGNGYSGGIGFYLEPKYNITDNIAAGLKMEWAVIGAESSAGMDMSISAIGAYQLTGDYYFNTNKVRPFAGLGVGLFSMGSADITASDGSSVADLAVDYGTKFGFTPRVGLLLGHFRTALEYNVITGLPSEFQSRNYLSLKLGFAIGGGKR